jgi:tetratricopeptide (TPR) repeat protein
MEGNEAEEAEKLRVIFNSNLSATLLKLKQPEKALEYAKDALKRDPLNLKAKYRKGEALISLGKYDNAIEDLNKALSEHPGELALTKLLQQAEKIKQRQEQEERMMYQKMFSQPQGGASRSSNQSNQNKSFVERIADSLFTPGVGDDEKRLLNYLLIGTVLFGLVALFLTEEPSIHLYIFLALAIALAVTVQWMMLSGGIQPPQKVKKNQ